MTNNLNKSEIIKMAVDEYKSTKAKLAADLMYNNAKIYLNRKYNIYKEQFCRE